MKTKIKGQYRQGDVLIRRVQKSNLGKFTAEKKKRVILAHGEATGHHHSVLECEEAEVGDIRVIIPRGESPEVVHQEHGPISIITGRAYKITRQGEYTPGIIRNVAD